MLGAGDLERLEERDLDRERERVLDAATVAEHMICLSCVDATTMRYFALL